jgi:hypothetical protein
MILTTAGRTVDTFPLFRLWDGGKWLLFLSRVEVSDVGDRVTAEALYIPLVVVQTEDQMTTVELRIGKYVLVVFIAPKKVSWHVFQPDQETEQ